MCDGTSTGRYGLIERERGNQVGRLLHHLKKVRDAVGMGREGVFRVERSRTVTGALEKDVLSWKLEVRLRDFPRARTPDSPRERGGRVDFRSEHPPMAVMEATGRSTCRVDMHES